jgi:RsiW-degrading membrane proteinase PrsW (M82 family)
VRPPAGELRISYRGQQSSYQPGRAVRIGRSLDNDVVISDPTVSRKHARLTWGPGGWVLEDTGRSGTYLNGSPVRRLVIAQPVDLALAAPDGPVVRVEAAPAPAGATPPPPAPAPPPAPPPPAPAPAPATAPAPSTEDPATPVPAVPALVTEPAPPPAGAVPSPAGPVPPPAGAVPSPAGPVPPPAGAVPSPAGPVPPPAGAPREELATAFQILVPVKGWLRDPGWRQGLRLLIIPYALLPLIFIGLFASSGNLSTPGWAYSLYIAPLWAIAFWHLIRPGPIRFIEAQIAIGIVVWVLLWLQLVTVHINDHLGAPGRFGVALAVGLNEEITKALPILVAALLLLWLRGTKLDVRMWMFLGTIAGLTFGVREQAFYTLVDIVGIAHAKVNTEAVVAVLAFAERVFVDGLQHAVWAGVSAFFIGMAVNYPRRRVWLIALGISIPVLLHAMNDWTASATGSIWAPVLIQAVSLVLFLGYTMSAASIERKVRRTPLFRGDSMLMERYSDPGT